MLAIPTFVGRDKTGVAYGPAEYQRKTDAAIFNYRKDVNKVIDFDSLRTKLQNIDKIIKEAGGSL